MIIRTLVARLLVVIFLILFIVPIGIVMLMPEKFRRHNRFVAWLMSCLYRTALWCSLVPITVKGKKNIPNSPVVIVANHQSSLDIPLLGSLLGRHSHIWIARSDLTGSWLFRFILPYFAIVTDVNSPIKSMRSLVKIIHLVKGEKCHVLIFPEGQRYDDDKVHEFFSGFVMLSKKIDRPVVPVRIFNANKVYAREAFWVRSYPITVVVGHPMKMALHETDDDFKKRVELWFAQVKE